MATFTIDVPFSVVSRGSMWVTVQADDFEAAVRAAAREVKNVPEVMLVGRATTSELVIDSKNAEVVDV